MKRRALHVAARAVLAWALSTAAPVHGELVEPGVERALAPEGAGQPLRTALATAPDGRSAAVWVVADAGSAAGLLLQLLAPDGSPEGAPLELASFTFRPLVTMQPTVAAASDGSFLVGWNDLALLARVVGPDGEPGPTVEIASSGGGANAPQRPRALADPRGGFVVVGRTQGPGSRIVLYRLDSDGTPLGQATVVAPAEEDVSLGLPQASVDASGSVVVVWSAEVREGHSVDQQVFGRWYDPAGKPLGPPTFLGQHSDDGLAVTHTSRGRVLVAWQVGTHGIELRRYDARGRLVGESSLNEHIDHLVDGEEGLHLVPLLGGGAFLAAVVDRHRDAFVGGLLLDASAAPLGDFFRISTFNYFGVRSASVSSDGRSGISTLWAAGRVRAEGVYSRPLRVLTAGAVSFAEPTYLAPEAGGPVRLAVRRTGFGEGAVSVEYETRDGSAEAGRDFRRVSGTLSWSDGDLSERAIEVPVLDDREHEGPEVVELVLTEPTGGAVLSEPAWAHLVIEDDDGRPAPGGSPSPLDAEAVACERSRLAGLLERLELAVPHSGKNAGINLSVTASGDFAGLAYTGNGPVTAEHHLAFSTDPEISPLLLNPERPQLPAVALVRNRVNSDLVAPGHTDTLRVRLRPTLGSGPADPAGLLVVDNVDGDPGRASQVKPGRGLAGLLAPCHSATLVARDGHVLRVLSKIVRLDVDGAVQTEIAIYRSEAIETYGIDAYALDAQGQPLGSASAELTVRYDMDGALSEGELRLVQPCPDGGCTVLDRPGRLLLVRPRFSGEFWRPTPYALSLPASPGDKVVAVDWRDLLGGTTWRRPN